MTQTLESPAALAKTNSGAIARVKYEPRAPVATPSNLKALLLQSQQQIADVLPKHLTPDRIIRVALIAVTKTPKLLQCTMESVLKSIMDAAALGLDPGGALGSAYLVPYGNTCTLIPGYRGLIDLARRSGEIQSITSEVVYQHDRFDYQKGTSPVLVHKPDIHSELKDEDIIGAYMVAHLKDGGTHVEFMNRQQIEKIRASSKAGHSGPWVTHYSEMCRKTVVRRGCKYLPISSEKLAKALDLDNELEEPATSIAQHEGRAKALLSKITEKPVSEGQSFEPTPEAEQTAAEELANHDFATGEVVEPDVSGVGEEPPPPDEKSWTAFHQALELAAKDRLIDVEQFDRGMKKFIVAKGLVGKPHLMSEKDKNDLRKAVENREGYFANPGQTTPPKA